VGRALLNSALPIPTVNFRYAYAYDSLKYYFTRFTLHVYISQSSKRAAYPVHLIVLKLIIVTIFGEEYKL